jgi:hypothetical protein
MNLDLWAYGLTRLGHYNEELRRVSGISSPCPQALTWFYLKKKGFKNKKVSYISSAKVDDMSYAKQNSDHHCNG